VSDAASAAVLVAEAEEKDAKPAAAQQPSTVDTGTQAVLPPAEDPPPAVKPSLSAASTQTDLHASPGRQERLQDGAF